MLLYLTIFSLGIIIGAGLVRYGIGLGVKIVEKTREDMPVFGEDVEATEQSYTE